MNRIFFVLFTCFIFSSAIAQPPVDRYTNEIFTAVNETNDVQFSTAVPQPNPGGGFYEFITGLPLNVDEFDSSPVDLKMDIFEPQGDTLSKRPLVIIAFGGGFLAGERTHWSIRLLCQELAKRGFVTASIDYRLGMNIFDEDLSKRAVYRGVQDGRSAIRFFREDAAGANQYKIDPDQIYIGGHSAGAFIALHNAYLEKETERPLSTFAWTQDGTPIPDQQCLDCVGDNLNFDGHANAIFSLAGGIEDVNYIETEDDPTLVMFHSEDDGTVPFDSGEPFGSILILVIGSDLPTSYGSLPISNRTSTLGLPYEFNAYTNRGHGVHEDGSSALYDDIIPGISNWFHNQELKPIYDTIFGLEQICSGGLEQTYSLPNGIGHYFDWSVTGGTFLQTSPYSSTATVMWDESATIHSLQIIPYSLLDARGDTSSLNINIAPSATNIFIPTNTSWESPTNWSLGRTPLPCDDIGISGNVPLVEILNNTSINSLTVGQNVNVEILPTAEVSIRQKSEVYPSEALIVHGLLTNNGMLTVQNVNIGKEVILTDNGELKNFNYLNLGFE